LEAAGAWWDGPFEKIAHLSSSPNYPVAEENDRFPFEMRAFPYRRPGSSVVYQVLYRVVEGTPDGPQVWVLHFRPGAAGPMQNYAAREIATRAEEMGRESEP
jgi:hypothetical protein